MEYRTLSEDACTSASRILKVTGYMFQTPSIKSTKYISTPILSVEEYVMTPTWIRKKINISTGKKKKKLLLIDLILTYYQTFVGYKMRKHILD